MDGFIVIDKQEGMTSHDVVARVRRLLCQKKAGHTGTLDPFATGVLPVAVGEGTKSIPFLDESIKEYRATMLLGAATDSQDFTGVITREGEWRHLRSEDVIAILHSFQGRSFQYPPMYSAVKQGGVPLYKLARKGQEVERKAREIEVFSLVVDHLDLPRVVITVTCSRGTYVRTLAHDAGEMLGCGAHLVQLRRTRSGPFHHLQAVTLEKLARIQEAGSIKDILVSPLDALSHLPEIVLGEGGASKVCRGISPDMGDVIHRPCESLVPGEYVRLAWGGKLVAVAENLVSPWTGDNKNLRLIRVFN
ncbi:MAG: tRNA pseudouridine(55) synthase TruB [Desulfuromonadales bacterium]|nr:MAG: tRNA pseudouridine(55) synthase TruB [Desulfuromonadales bacterium]